MDAPYRKWQCFFCGLIYDERAGMPEEGIAPGTRWEDIPADWICPGCGAGKSEFAMMDVG
jgi:rubredoxin